MRVEATFKGPLGEYNVVLTNKGFEVNELEDVHGGHAFYVDADHPMNWSNFQIADDEAKNFIRLAEAIYGFNCDLDGEVTDSYSPETGELLTKLFYTDFIIEKGGASPSLSWKLQNLFTLEQNSQNGMSPSACAEAFNPQPNESNTNVEIQHTKVHFARMSAGEKKLATLLRMLCNPDNTANRDIILIDNIECHVYHKRHAIMIDKLREFFPNKQIIATTHSGTMINHVNKSFRYDLEFYRPEYKMNEYNKQVVEEMKEDTRVNPSDVLDVIEALKSGDVKLQTVPAMYDTVPEKEKQSQYAIGSPDNPDLVIYGPASLGDMVWDYDSKKQVRRIDRLLSTAITFEEDGKPGGNSLPIHFPTPPHIKLEAERKRAEAKQRAEEYKLLLAAETFKKATPNTTVEVKAVKKASFAHRIRNAVKAFKFAWKQSAILGTKVNIANDKKN